MSTRGSEKVAKRRTAAQRVQEKLAAQVAAMTEAVDAAMSAAADREKARAAEAAADDRLRAAVARLAELDQSHEEIAELVELDVTEVRALRRPKRTADEDQAEAAAELLAPGPRRSRQLAVPPVLPAVRASAGEPDDGDPAAPDAPRAVAS